MGNFCNATRLMSGSGTTCAKKDMTGRSVSRPKVGNAKRRNARMLIIGEGNSSSRRCSGTENGSGEDVPPCGGSCLEPNGAGLVSLSFGGN
jgi:hypothetical protein